MTNQLELQQQVFKKTPVFIAFASLAFTIVALSLAAIFIKLSEQEISPNALVFHRYWIATTVFALWNQLNTRSNQLSGDQLVKKETSQSWIILLLLALGTCSLTSQYCLVWSLTRTSAANATLLRNFTPVFTILVGWLLFHRRFNSKFLMGVVIAVGGAFSLGFNDWQISSDTLQGDVLALLSAMFYSGSILTIEKLRTELDTATIMLWRCAIGTVLTVPIMLIGADRIWPDSVSGWLVVIAFAIVCQVLGQGALAYCLKHLSAGFVSIALLLEPFITTCFAWAIFSESLSVLNGVAFVLVLLGIYLAQSSSSAVKE